MPFAQSPAPPQVSTHGSCSSHRLGGFPNKGHLLNLVDGGHKLLLYYAGQDMTTAFEEAHGENNLRVEMLLAPFLIGDLDPNPPPDSNPERSQQYEKWQEAMYEALQCRSIINCSVTGEQSDIAEAHVLSRKGQGLGMSIELYERLKHGNEHIAHRIFDKMPGGRDTTVHEFAVTAHYNILLEACRGVQGAYVDGATATAGEIPQNSCKGGGDTIGTQRSTQIAVQHLLQKCHDESRVVEVGAHVGRLVRHDIDFITDCVKLTIAGAALAREMASDDAAERAKQKSRGELIFVNPAMRA